MGQAGLGKILVVITIGIPHLACEGRSVEVVAVQIIGDVGGARRLTQRGGRPPVAWVWAPVAVAVRVWIPGDLRVVVRVLVVAVGVVTHIRGVGRLAELSFGLLVAKAILVCVGVPLNGGILGRVGVIAVIPAHLGALVAVPVGVYEIAYFLIADDLAA